MSSNRMPNDLLEAVKTGRDADVKICLEQIPSGERSVILNQPLTMDDNDTLLCLAVKGRHLATAEVLLANGANPNLAGSSQETPLHCAAFRDFADIIQLLLARGAKANIARSDGEMPIHVAAMNNSVEAVNALVAHDATQLTLGGSNGCTALYRAAMRGRFGVMDLLLNKYHDNINQTNPYHGGGMLHYAAANNKSVLAKYLAEHQAKIDLPNQAGFTPLQCCAMQKKPSLDVAKILIEFHADVNAGDQPPFMLLGSTPKQCKREAIDEFSALLKAHGASTDTAANSATAAASRPK